MQMEKQTKVVGEGAEGKYNKNTIHSPATSSIALEVNSSHSVYIFY